MSVKDKYLSFALCLAVAIIIVVTLVGCTENKGTPERPDRDKDGIEILESTLIGRAQGCDIYKIHRGFTEDPLYLTECGKGESSISSTKTTMVNDIRKVTTTTNMVVQK